MKAWFWALVVWQLGTGSLHAAPWWQGAERLEYAVYWGGLKMGKAELAYKTTPAGYVMEIKVKDSTPLITMNSRWEITGGKNWTSNVWESWQKENSYDAHKRLTFGKGGAVFENMRGEEPSATVVLPKETRDVMSALYAWRAAGSAALATGRTAPVVAGKTPFDLTVSAGVRGTMQLGKEMVPVQRVEMRVPRRKGKGEDVWQVWVREGAEMVPLRIVAKLKFGSFDAQLKERKLVW